MVSTYGTRTYGAAVQPLVVAPNRLIIYPSAPPYQPSDVLLQPQEFVVGEGRSLASTSAGAATVTASMGAGTAVITQPAGQATVSTRLDLRTQVRLTSTGRAVVLAYLGSPQRLTSTSAGRAALTANYLGSPVRFTSTAAGRAAALAYLSTPQRIAATSAGRASALAYLSAPQRLSLTSAGRGLLAAYLSSPQRVAAISAGRASVASYLSGPVPLATLPAGRSAVAIYLSGPESMSASSAGVAALVARLPQAFALAHRSTGVGQMTAAQRGPVYLSALSAGRASGEMRTQTLLSSLSQGVGHMVAARPGAVFMQWGTGPAYYQPEFPVADPILMPKGSNGISHMIIEIDTIPILRSRSTGVGHLQAFQIDHRPLAWTTRSNPIPQHDSGDFLHSYTYAGLPTKGGEASVSATLYQAPPIIVSNGVGHLDATMRVAYLVRWQRVGDGEYVRRVNGLTYVGEAGAQGHMSVAGPPMFVSLTSGRGGGLWDLSAVFAADLLANGVSTALLDFVGGSAALAKYGNLLRYFFEDAPLYGQFWPRREARPIPV